MLIWSKFHGFGKDILKIVVLFDKVQNIICLLDILEI